MKKIILLTLIMIGFYACSEENINTSKCNVQKAIDAISDKSSAKSIIFPFSLYF